MEEIYHFLMNTKWKLNENIVIWPPKASHRLSIVGLVSSKRLDTFFKYLLTLERPQPAGEKFFKNDTCLS